MSLLWLTLAWAQEEPCGGVLPVEELHVALDATEEALAELQVDRDDRILDDVIDVLRCIGTPLEPSDLGRLARHVSLVAFYDADQAELRSWTWLERDTVGGSWPSDVLPVPDTFHALRAELSEPPMVTAEGGWLAPKKGAVWLDGRPSEGPTARSEVPHLLQMLDKKGRVTWSGWMVGSDAPEQWFDPQGGPVEVPRWASAPPPPAPWDDAVVVVDEPVEVPDVDEPAEPVDDDTVEGRKKRPRRTTEFMEIFPDCPWRRGPGKVSVEGSKVQINRFEYSVRSADDLAEAQAVFRRCGEFRAARRLARYAEARKKLFAAADAREQRDALVRVLLAEEPTRKK